MLDLFSYQPTYPNAAGYKTGGASKEAAKKIDGKLNELQSEVYYTLESIPMGATAEEIAYRLGRSPLSIKPRLSELSKKGLIIKTDRRGKTEMGGSCHIWEVNACNLTEKGNN